MRQDKMTLNERIMRASASRAHLGGMMDWFEQVEEWDKYLYAAMLFHDFDRLLKKLQKEESA